MSDVEIDQFVLLLTDFSAATKKDDKIIKAEMICVLSEYSDIVYVQSKLPFPFSNRDVCQRRFILSNKKHPELIESFGLPQKKSTAYFIFNEAIALEECPTPKGFERAKMYTLTVVEEHPTKPGAIKVTNVGQNDPGGSIPDSIINKMATKMSKKRLAQTLKKYFELKEKSTK